MTSMVRLRLRCTLLYVDVRLREFDGRFLASADASGGPTLGTGTSAIEAITVALQPFCELRDELLQSLPPEVN
jgi:hypothetical protein